MYFVHASDRPRGELAQSVLCICMLVCVRVFCYEALPLAVSVAKRTLRGYGDR